jgi:magnesium-transporting ATPase (P-type)
MGVEFIGKDEDENMIIKIYDYLTNNKVPKSYEYKFKLLFVLPFNSKRKRQSVVLKYETEDN